MDKDASEAWLRNFAEESGIAYRTLMDAARDWVGNYEGAWGREYLCLGGLLEGHYVPYEFWGHYDLVKSVETPEECKKNFFTCSC